MQTNNRYVAERQRSVIIEPFLFSTIPFYPSPLFTCSFSYCYDNGGEIFPSALTQIDFINFNQV